MKGKLIVYRPMEMEPHEVVELTAAPDFQVLHDHVQGPLEVVPSFREIKHDGKISKCVVFVNEDGRDKDGVALIDNDRATSLWEWSLRRQGLSLLRGRRFVDFVKGNCVVVIGDDELLRAL